MSFRDHSLFITTGKFSSLRTLKGQPYAEWAEALEKAGFQPVPEYAMQVKKVVRQYGLERWDGK
jgi:flagellum-specific peptidoglycan hydrolase FlgJ